MELVHEQCVGLDGHKKSAVTCRILPADVGGWQKEKRRFGSMTDELLKLAEWLRAGAGNYGGDGEHWDPPQASVQHSGELV